MTESVVVLCVGRVTQEMYPALSNFDSTASGDLLYTTTATTRYGTVRCCTARYGAVPHGMVRPIMTRDAGISLEPAPSFAKEALLQSLEFSPHRSPAKDALGASSQRGSSNGPQIVAHLF